MKTGDDYFDSEEFRELLAAYEESVSSGQPILMDADELTDIADYYHYIADDERADEAINQALALSPGATSPLVYKIHEALADEDIEEAQNLIEQMLDKSDPEYTYMQAEVLIAQNKIDEADELLRQEFLNTPTDEHNDYVMDVANLYLDYGVNDKSYEWMMRSAGNNSEDFKELMGHIMFGLGKFKDSERIFNELLDRNPYSTRYWNALANAQFMSEDYDNSVSSSEYAMAIDPTDSESILTKANGLYRLSNYEEALKYYRRYNELSPNYDFVRLQIGICLLNLNQQDEAIQELELAKQLTYDGSSYQVQIYQELAFAYSSKGMLKEALANIDETKELECDHNDMEVLRGHILLENRQWAQAEECFKQAVRNSEGAQNVLLRIIVSLYDNKFVSPAYTLFKKYFQIYGPDTKDGYAYMALCCWDLKKTEEFLHYLQLAVESNPNEAHMVLHHMFPEDLEPQDYYRYMNDKLSI